MNLNHLHIFRAVAAAGSVSRAAVTLHISQSAVSKQLRDFEQQLGLVLFERLPRGMRLTSAGNLLYGYANRLFAIEREAEAALGDLHQLTRGSITIGASRTIGAYMLPPALARFHAAFPAVELHLQVTSTQAIETMLLAGEIDIGFAEGTIGREQLDYTVFAQDELLLIAAPGHPALARAPLPVARLADYPLLMHEVGSGTRAVTEHTLAQHGVMLRPAMTLASTEAIKQTVATGAGLAILSRQALVNELEGGRLQVLPLADARFQRPLYRLQLRGAWPSPALQALLAMLNDEEAPDNEEGAPGRIR